MSRLSLQLLGPFAAHYDGEPLSSFRTRSVQALLVYLTCQPETHRRESLMALLWPDARQASAQNSLRQALYYLRRAVPEIVAKEGDGRVPFVLSDREIVQVNPQASFELDVTTFENRLKAPQEQWQEAVNLYRGDFLYDLTLPDSSPFEMWALTRRANLRRQVISALDVLVAIQMEQDAYEEAERLARRQLIIDGLHELAHLRLMEILLHQARRSQALSHYETYCRILDEELGVEPAEACAQFIEEVRGGVLVPSGLALSTSTAHAVPKHNLRPQPTRLIGRERELDELCSLAAGRYRRLINILGAGGMGKSRLAMAFAERQLEELETPGRSRFADGVFFVPLQTLRNKDQIVVAIAEALGLPLDSDERRSLQQQLLDFLPNKQLLLILDSFEHLLDEADLLAEILACAPRLRLLVTSRQRLDLYAEQVYPLRGLDYPDEAATREVKVLNDYTSAALFLDRARRILPDYTPSTDEAYDIATLCRLVSGIPLALELAASWIDVLPPSQMVTEIRRSLDFLVSSTRDLPERHRSMRAVLDSTWSQLSTDERATLAQLSVFRGGFDALTAEAVAGANRHTLARLVHKSILQHDIQDARYNIHELLRQYSERRLSTPTGDGDERPLEHAVHHRHSAYYCKALREWEKGLKSRRQRGVLTTIAREWDNVRTAWEWAASHHDVALLEQATEGLGVTISCQGHHQTGEQLFGVATQAAREILASATPHASNISLVYARLMIWHAHFSRAYEHQCRREELAEASLTILEELQAQDIDTRLERARAWQLISLNHRNAWRHAEALEAAQNSLVLSRAVQDDWSVAGALEALGRSAFYLRRYEEGREWLESCLALQRKLGNRAGEAQALYWLADIAGSQGQFARDEELMRACLAIHEALGNQRAMARTLGSVATDLSHQGRFREAALLFADAITRSRHLGIHWMVAYHLGGLATVKESLGLYDEAASLAQEALALIRGHNVTLVQALGLRILSTIAIVQKRYGDARRLLQEREKLLRDSPLGIQIGLACQSYVATANEDFVQSTQVLQAALRGGDQAAASLLWTLPAGALLLARMGAIPNALALYAAATRRPFVGNSRWFDDVAGAPLREMARALPPAVVQEAEDRGRAWDIWQAGTILLKEIGANADDSSGRDPSSD